jgi:hypothetical protein
MCLRLLLIAAPPFRPFDQQRASKLKSLAMVPPIQATSSKSRGG